MHAHLRSHPRQGLDQQVVLKNLLVPFVCGKASRSSHGLTQAIFSIKSFFRFLEYRQPAAPDQIRRVLAIPFKKTDQRLVPYLTQHETQALLDEIT